MPRILCLEMTALSIEEKGDASNVIKLTNRKLGLT